MSKTFTFDEKQAVLDIVENGFPNDKTDFIRMYSVAKYLRDEFGYGQKKLESALIEFVMERDKEFNPVLQRDAIKRWVNSAMQYKLRKVDKIYIYEPELAFLRSVEQTKDRKILLAMLIMSKAYSGYSVRRKPKDYPKSEYYYIKYGNFSDIINYTGINNLSEVGMANILHEYLDHIGICSVETESIRLDYINETGKPVILRELSDFNAIYIQLFGEHDSKCPVCGNMYTKTSNRQKVCMDCAKEIERETTRERVAKNRGM